MRFSPMRIVLAAILIMLALSAQAAEAPGFRPSPWFGEQIREEGLGNGVRAVVIAAGDHDAEKPTRLVVYTTPNGTTIEQTLGCRKADRLDGHFDIQHAAAQVRTLRDGMTAENVVLACVEAEGLSWPAWKQKKDDGPATIRKVVETLRGWVPGKFVRVHLAGHSGGGSFLFGYIDGGEIVPSFIERFIFLDANYSYSDSDKHGDKLLAWLSGDRSRRLVVIAYDDRTITLNGKPLVGPDGGTHRATGRMRARFAKEVQLIESKEGEFLIHTGLDGRIALYVHTNPQTKILHTALVGEMNGLLRGLSDPGAKPDLGTFGGPRAYTKWVQPAPDIPARPKDAVKGQEFFRKLAKLSAAEREDAIAAELLRGNLPEFLRTFQKVTVTRKDRAGKLQNAVVDVMPDYLAVGSDTDFVRVPMTARTAARVADAFGCTLPTRKLVDEIYQAASVKLAPQPMTRDRDSAVTFFAHHMLIEEHRTSRKLGDLLAGVKKDVVASNRLAEMPDRVAIYGWHQSDGKPIQPLTIVHHARYVDYSHGVRLVKREMLVDGTPKDIRQVTSNSDLCPLLSDEGPLTRPTY